MTWRRHGLPLLLLAWYAVQTHAYVPVWQDNLALWTHAHARAPLKPRPALNLSGYLLAAGRVQDGVSMMVEARRLADGRHVPAWDAEITRARVEHNLRALAGVVE